MFKMVLMLEAMGIYRLIRYKATPTTINTMTRFSNGILQCSWDQEGAFRCPIARRRVPRAFGTVRNAPDKLCNAALFGKVNVVEATTGAFWRELWKSGGVVTQGRRLKSTAPDPKGGTPVVAPSPALTLRDFASEMV
jgi:hypothetical protein